MASERFKYLNTIYSTLFPVKTESSSNSDISIQILSTYKDNSLIFKEVEREQIEIYEPTKGFVTTFR